MKLLVFIITILNTLSAHSETLTIASDYWYPMNGEPAAEKPGYMIEIATAIFKPHNINIEYKLMPWERSVIQTRSGTYNCVVGAYKTDTPDFIFPKEHWGFDTPKFFTLKDDPWIFNGSIASIKERNIGLIQGYNYYSEFDEYAKKQTGMHIQYARSEIGLETNIKKLFAGRIDTLVESSNVLHAKLNELGKSGTLKESGNITKPVAMYMACSPKLASSERFINIINQDFLKLKQTGKLNTILNRYGLEAW